MSFMLREVGCPLCAHRFLVDVSPYETLDCLGGILNGKTRPAEPGTNTMVVTSQGREWLYVREGSYWVYYQKSTEPTEPTPPQEVIHNGRIEL